jgi:S1-C subfamily serine protease
MLCLHFIFRGGLKPGDIVTHVSGSPVHAASNIYQALESGQPLKMTVVRGTEHLQIKVIPEDG